MHTFDASGKAVLFQMSQYSSTTAQGSNLRIFQVSEPDRIPVLVADRAKWNGSGWQLETDLWSAGSGKKKGEMTKTVADSGFLYMPEAGAGGPGDIQQSRTLKTAVKEWRGAVTPSFLESDRLGPGVMNLNEIAESSRVKPALEVEWWRRVSEWTMGIFLLWIAIPLLVSEEHGIIRAVGISILFSAVYWSLNIACAEAARGNGLPVWAPLIPTALFFAIGWRQYHWKMAT
jgi:lipopolysaccharide export LptBFGC system permease protein LptF